MQEFTRQSIITGKYTTRTLDITEEQHDDWYIRGVLIQRAMPNLSADDREWLMTGVTSEEWAAAFESGGHNESV